MTPRYISSEIIEKAVVDAYAKLSFSIDPAVLTLLGRAMDAESSPVARDIIHDIIRNAELAHSEHLPPCQDTGTQICFIEIGNEVLIEGGSLEEIINHAIAKASQSNYLRASIVRDPLFNRTNTGDNCPAVFHVKHVRGSQLKLQITQKGGGAENMSRLLMLSPNAKPNDIISHVLDTVILAGSKACPPLIIGIGIGGNYDSVTQLAKHALLRDLLTPHPELNYAHLERDILEAVNASGIGVQGMGGNTTALRVLINAAPCHIASLPLAINLQCHSHKHIEIVI